MGTLAVGIFNPSYYACTIKGIVIVGAFVFISFPICMEDIRFNHWIRVDEETEVNGLDIHETGLSLSEFKRA